MTLTPQQTRRKNELTLKLQTKVLTPPEADELKGILEQEKNDAITLGDLGKALAVILLIGLVVAFLKDK